MNTFKKTKYKNKFTIITICLIIATVLLLCFAVSHRYHNPQVVKQEQEQALLIAEQQEQLTDAISYLNTIDEIVTANQQWLSKVNLETEKELSSVLDQLYAMNEYVLKTNSSIEKYVETYLGDKVVTNEITETLDVLFTKHEEINMQIQITQDAVTEILNDFKYIEETHYTKTIDKLTNVLFSFEEIKTEIEIYHSDLFTLIEYFQENEDKKHEELLTIMLNAEKEFKLLFVEYTENIQLQISANLLSLTQDLNALNKQITQAESFVSNTLMLLEENAGSRHEETNSAFGITYKMLDTIEANFAIAQQETKALILNIQESGMANYEETLNILQTLDTIESYFMMAQQETKALILNIQESGVVNHEETLNILQTLDMIESNFTIAQQETKTLILNIQESGVVNHEETLNILQTIEMVESNFAIAQQETKALILNIQESGMANHEETLNILQTLDTIESNFTVVQQETNKLILNIQESGMENHKETLNILQTMEKGMGANEVNVTQNFSQLMDSLESLQKILQENFDSSINSIHKDMWEGFDYIDYQISRQIRQMMEISEDQFDFLYKNIIYLFMSQEEFLVKMRNDILQSIKASGKGSYNAINTTEYNVDRDIKTEIGENVILSDEIQIEDMITDEIGKEGGVDDEISEEEKAEENKEVSEPEMNEFIEKG